MARLNHFRSRKRTSAITTDRTAADTVKIIFFISLFCRDLTRRSAPKPLRSAREKAFRKMNLEAPRNRLKPGTNRYAAFKRGVYLPKANRRETMESQKKNQN